MFILCECMPKYSDKNDKKSKEPPPPIDLVEHANRIFGTDYILGKFIVYHSTGHSWELYIESDPLKKMSIKVYTPASGVDLDAFSEYIKTEQAYYKHFSLRIKNVNEFIYDRINSYIIYDDRYMIGPLARGENLIEIMKNNRVAQLAIDWIIYQLLRILAKIKEYDLLIGDIKLESIIVDENFDITLIDFFPGIPKFPAVSVGYISPEQLEDVTSMKRFKMINIWSNIWSLGIVYCKMLCFKFLCRRLPIIAYQLWKEAAEYRYQMSSYQHQRLKRFLESNPTLQGDMPVSNQPFHPRNLRDPKLMKKWCLLSNKTIPSKVLHDEINSRILFFMQMVIYRGDRRLTPKQLLKNTRMKNMKIEEERRLELRKNMNLDRTRRTYDIVLPTQNFHI
eukprot:GHVL01016891.1.p1 GENE.GHVL01016891.1~~GHVL01016891.1.p1  ORF type:complete len:420 (+),score=85.69 GHVL01016891.1:83-1261(+)